MRSNDQLHPVGSVDEVLAHRLARLVRLALDDRVVYGAVLLELDLLVHLRIEPVAPGADGLAYVLRSECEEDVNEIVSGRCRDGAVKLEVSIDRLGVLLEVLEG